MERLIRQAESWGISISVVQRQTLLAYARELAGYEKANVIGTRGVDEILSGHILDSLSCFLFSPLCRAESLIDVGSGGGLPGIPISILQPRLKTALLEATGKKAEFLHYVVERLGLDNVNVVNDRAENVGREPNFRGSYDVATVRAVAGLDVNAEYCVPLLRIGGHMLSMKASLDEREVVAGEKATRLLGADISDVVEISYLPELPEKHRNLIVASKLSETPHKYPRKNGTPRKKPLGAEQSK